MKRKISEFMTRIKKADVFSRNVFTVLYSSAFVCIMVIAVSQVGLRSENTRRFFTRIDNYEGGYFEATINVAQKPVHSITLLAEGDDIEKVRLYMNGEEYGGLLNGENTVEISGVSVLEVYSPKGSVKVKISDVSDDVVIYTPDREITVENEMKFLCRVGIK